MYQISKVVFIQKPSPDLFEFKPENLLTKNLKRFKEIKDYNHRLVNENDMFIGVLCQLGKNGLEKVIELDLNEEEKAGLENSRKHVEELLSALKNLDY